MNEKILRRDYINLLVICGLYSLALALSNIFVNLYIWNQYESLLVLGYYNSLVLVTQLFAIYSGGKLCKWKDRVFVLRLGILFYTLFYLAVLMTRNWPVEKILLLGTFSGLAAGLYWISFNVLVFEVTSPDTRSKFLGVVGMLTSLGTLIGPMTSALIIQNYGLSGYYFVFILSLSLFVIASIISIFLHRRKRMGKFQLKRAKLAYQLQKNYRIINWAHFFQGLREGVFAFTISTYLFIITNNELAVGQYMLVHSIVSIISYFFVSRILKPKYRLKSIAVSAIFLFLSLFIIIGTVTMTNFIIYAVVIAFMYPFMLVPFQSISYDVVGKLPNLGEYRLEYLVWRDLFLTTGRLISVIFYIICLFTFPTRVALPIILLVLGSGHSIIYFIVRKLEG